jgi:hypothetical protein
MEKALILEEIEKGFDVCSCKKCGCMKYALDNASDVLDVITHLQRMEEVERDCFECDPCYGANVHNMVMRLKKG